MNSRSSARNCQRAAEIEQEIDADIVADESGDPDDRALALLVAAALATAEWCG
jgi:hypothetical protein